jgi:isoquinoline 1-oxidoreductase
MGDTELTPFDMGTFGSRSTPQMGMQLRRAGASARELLIGLAAERWKVDRSRLVGGERTHRRQPDKRSIGFGELTAGRKLTETIRADVAPKPASQWTVAGTSLPKIGAHDVVTGRHEYTSDMRLPGMLYGRVLRAPQMGATLAAVDTSAVSGVVGAVVVRDGELVGIAAPSGDSARSALAAMKPTWTPRRGRSRRRLPCSSTSSARARRRGDVRSVERVAAALSRSCRATWTARSPAAAQARAQLHRRVHRARAARAARGARAVDARLGRREGHRVDGTQRPVRRARRAGARPRCCPQSACA